MKVRRNGRLIYFVFNNNELSAVRSSLNEVTNGVALKLRAHWHDTGADVDVEFSLSEIDSIVVNKRSVLLALDRDSLEYAAHKIDEMIQSKSPATPEFIEFPGCSGKGGSGGKSIHTYFSLEVQD